MNSKVRNHAERLVQVWNSFTVISYSLGGGRIAPDKWLLRIATIEDAPPELYRVLKSNLPVLGHDFGAIPCLQNDDVAVVNIAQRFIPDYWEQLGRREVECAKLLAVLDDDDDSRAAITRLVSHPDLALAYA